MKQTAMQGVSIAMAGIEINPWVRASPGLGMRSDWRVPLMKSHLRDVQVRAVAGIICSQSPVPAFMIGVLRARCLLPEVSSGHSG